MTYTAGSLFSGIGGFDLGFQQAGFSCGWWVEKNSDAAEIMEKHWPGVGYGDIRDFLQRENIKPVDVIYGGDPCPRHSKARSTYKSTKPDLSGYFLAVVGRLRPRWVVRENVPSASNAHFDLALALLGYGTAIIEMDAAEITGQSRKREFVIGRYQTSRVGLVGMLQGATPVRTSTRPMFNTREVAACLTTNRARYDSRDNYIFEQTNSGYELRIPDGDERDVLAGFPFGWTAGFHEATRARLLGNSVVPAKARWLAVRIASSLAADADDIRWAEEEVDKYLEEIKHGQS